MSTVQLLKHTLIATVLIAVFSHVFHKLVDIPDLAPPCSPSGLLQANPGLPANQGVEAAGLLPRSHGAQHLPPGPAAGVQQGAGLPPSPPRLQLGL